MYVCEGKENCLKFDVLTKMNEMFYHTAAVKKLAWRPSDKGLFLASCSVDHCVKIFAI